MPGHRTNGERPGRPPRLPALLLLAFLPLAACRDDATGPAERTVEGVNLTELFAPPTEAEVQAVLAEWGGRSPGVQQVRTEAEIPVTLAGSPGTLRIVSHQVDGHRHVGGVMAPDGAEAGSLPVLVYAHGGDQGTSASELSLIALAMGELADDVVLVAPAFRSEPFAFQDTVFTAEGDPSPWDRDVDDALALIRVAARAAPGADTTRVGVLGFSRGAGVGLLMGIRDPLVDRVVAFFGPTDFFSPWVRDVTEEALRGTLRDLPGLRFLDREFIQPLKRGELGIARVRPEMVRRSPVLFAPRLPAVQLHHGLADETVPVEQAESLIRVMDELGRPADRFQAFLYEGGRHDPFSLEGSIPRAREFLLPLVESGGGLRVARAGPAAPFTP